MASLLIVRPGMLTTVQDLGRWGHQHLGVPVAGAMDWYSHSRANRLVGNPESAATLEITLIGPEVEADVEVICAVSGADFELHLAGEPAPSDRAIRLRPGQRLRFGGRRSGARAFLAVAGGLEPPSTLGSRSTSLASRMGPFGGRTVAAGDVVPIGSARASADGTADPLPLPSGGGRLRVMPGPHDDRFTAAALEILTRQRYTITPESNRMGYRLAGPALEHLGGADILSDATPMGSLQVPSTGQPILLMADRQTTGGYPKIATVITADLPVAGQLAPGDWIEFVSCSRREAAAALKERLTALRRSDA